MHGHDPVFACDGLDAACEGVSDTAVRGRGEPAEFCNTEAKVTQGIYSIAPGAIISL